MKKFYFLSGLPRTGSTLLSSILNQNPEIHSGPNSPICAMLFNLEMSIKSSEQWAAYPKPSVIKNTVYGVLENYYLDRSERFIIDKNREWSAKKYFDTLTRNLDYAPKSIVMVRDINDILASFINLIKNSDGESFIDRDIRISGGSINPWNADTTRCEFLMRPNGLIDNSLSAVYNAKVNIDSGSFHFIEYSDLSSIPEYELEKLYQFLDIPKFDHDFLNIVNTFEENNDIYGIRGMHDVRSSVSASNIDAKEILPREIYEKYKNMEFWR